MHQYDTLTEAVEDLKRRGYTLNFNLAETCLECRESEILIHPKDFLIDEAYRFEGETDPGDENIVYAISSPANNMKGILVNAFGTYADSISGEMEKKLRWNISGVDDPGNDVGNL